MKVTLITHTPEPEKVIATAAKLCYASADIDTLMDGLTPEKIDSFLDMLTNIGMRALSSTLRSHSALRAFHAHCLHR